MHVPAHPRSIVRCSLAQRAWLATLLIRTAGGSPALAQWTATDTHTRASFRGLGIAPDGTVWVGGTDGIVVRSGDGGAAWWVDTVRGARSFDFRGVAAIDARTAYALVSSTDTARIYKTTDGGASWLLEYDDERPGIFLDGIGCWTAQRCVAAGDPIGGRFMILATSDAGAHWTPLPDSAAPTALPGEAAFAASNSSVIARGDGRAWLATGGGGVARVWRSSDYGSSWTVATTPITAGLPSAGIFSLAFCDARHGVAVGGDYRQPENAGTAGGAAGSVHVATTDDGGATWHAGDGDRRTPYLSGVACVRGGSSEVVAVGPGGTFASRDGGRSWARRDAHGFNAVAASERGLVAVGADGAAAFAPVTAWAKP